MAQWLNATITNRTDWNEHLFSLRFTCSDFPKFTAGQFTKLGIEKDSQVISRPYSLIANPVQQDYEIIAVTVEDGMLSPLLHQLRVGDRIKIMSPATGFLVLDEVPKSRDLWLLATGTGVGPFLSILMTKEAWDKYDNIILVYGARFSHDLAYRSLIESILSEYPDRFHFVSVISRESHLGSLQGRFPELLDAGLIQNKVGLDIDAHKSQVMLCGNPAMIQDTVESLKKMGLKKHLRRSPGQISLERYW
jgi:ferredoxin--NADP+ reductase